MHIIPSVVQCCTVGLDKICLAKFEQNGQPKERSNSASKMGSQFCQKKQNGQRMSFEFLDCMALATIPAKLLLDLLLSVPIYFVSHVGGFIKKRA